MGDLKIHSLENYAKDLSDYVFIETGTGMGEGLGYAKNYPFKRLHSIEYVTEIYNKVNPILSDYRTFIYNGSSESELPKILSTEYQSKILFWLDAHFPGADFHLNDYNFMKDLPEHMPLERELELIKSIRDISKDIFIIDDLQLYEQGNFENYNPGFVNIYGKIGKINFENIFSLTHNLFRIYRHQGFLIALPKE